MNVDVLLFAAAREVAGTDRLSVEVPDGATVTQLFEHLKQRRPALTAVLTTCRAAVGEQFVQGTTKLAEGSVVAVLPPVSGG